MIASRVLDISFIDTNLTFNYRLFKVNRSIKLHVVLYSTIYNTNLIICLYNDL